MGGETPPEQGLISAPPSRIDVFLTGMLRVLGAGGRIATYQAQTTQTAKEGQVAEVPKDETGLFFLFPILFPLPTGNLLSLVQSGPMHFIPEGIRASRVRWGRYQS